MLTPHTFAAALFMMILSTVCWGSWANTYKAARGYRFELFYWDYSVGVVLLTLLLAFTAGSTERGAFSFLENVHRARGGTLLYAAAGGFLFNIANTLLVAGIEMAGLAVAFPLAIGLALVEGVVLSYAVQPKGNMALLGAGVALAVAAVLLVGRAYASLAGGGRATSRKGVVVCVVSGLLMGLFAPLVTRALTADPPLTPYATAVFFALGAFACCFVFNVYLMRRPLVGAPVRAREYFRAGGRLHLIGMAGGAVWGVGLVCNLAAANLVGVSVAYAVGQAAPMIAALWGVLVWQEFRGAGRRATAYLTAMFGAYLLALALISEAYRAS
jgi:glucose uptake protein